MHLLAENPRYLDFRGHPVLLVGSGEHYGALLNAGFDYNPYLENLSRHSLNQLRVFSGSYRELPGEFGIVSNNLAPREEAFLCPWMRGKDGRYDLTTFNPDYFTRLHAFLEKTSRLSIAVELTLFCFWYNPSLWVASPMHPGRTVQGIGPEDKEGVFTVQGNDLLPYQEALVLRLVDAVKDYDHVYLEICNEPYSRHDHTAYLEWQHHMVDVIVSAETGHAEPHLIAMNYANRTQRIPNLHPAVTICNFHYALPDAVKENYHQGRVIADDETGFLGQTAEPYRREAWLFMLAGGGVFSHLDYSYTVQYPDGSGKVQGSTPGYGGEDLRSQLSFLRRYLEAAEVWQMQPYNEMFAWQAGRVPAQVLCRPGRRYLAYFSENTPGTGHSLALPAGKYELRWTNPTHGHTFLHQNSDHPGGYLWVSPPNHVGDLLLDIHKTA